MVQTSVTQEQVSLSGSQVRRRWQVQFRHRMHQEPLTNWRCIGIDIGKYEHVGVAIDGLGNLLAKPIRFGIHRRHYKKAFSWMNKLCADVDSLPVIGMEPTSHYYEQFAYEAAVRYGREQVYLVQSYDVSQRRKTWNKGSFKNDDVDASIVAQLLH